MIRPTTGDGRLTVPSSKSMRERWSATPIPRSNMCTSAQDRTGECAWELCKGILEGGNFTERNPATAHRAGVWHGRVQKWWRKGWSGAHQTFSEERVVSIDTGQTPHTAPMFRMSSRLVTVVAKHARDRPRRVDVRHLAKPWLKAPQSNQTKQTNQY